MDRSKFIFQRPCRNLPAHFTWGCESCYEVLPRVRGADIQSRSDLGLVVLSDFDGTIVEIDTAAYVLDRFAEGDWGTFDEQLKRGEITLEECMRRQFSLIKASQQNILKQIDEVATFRPNFEKLAEYCKSNHIPLIIVSAGLDFCIRHLLRRSSSTKSLELIGPKLASTSEGITFTFPKRHFPESFNFKDDAVSYFRKMGERVAFIGDSLNDYQAAIKADFPFAIMNSDLAKKLTTDRVPHKAISDFQPVVDALRLEC